MGTGRPEDLDDAVLRAEIVLLGELMSVVAAHPSAYSADAEVDAALSFGPHPVKRAARVSSRAVAEDWDLDRLR